MFFTLSPSASSSSPGGAGRCGELVHGFVVVVAQLCQILPGLDDRLARRHSDAAHGSTDGQRAFQFTLSRCPATLVHRLPEGGVDGAGEADDGLHDLVFACHQCHLLLYFLKLFRGIEAALSRCRLASSAAS